jgi:cell division protein FtsI (penicillin-binding protein 3)
VVSADTARKVTGLLVEAVSKGSSPTAIVPGYKLAGKTGTAQVPEGNGYSRTKYIASYVGYLPADDPRLLILVKVDNPKDVPWGTTVAAPVFREVASKALAYYGIPPSGNPR